jgi:hypothetical protein
MWLDGLAVRSKIALIFCVRSMVDDGNYGLKNRITYNGTATVLAVGIC